MNKTVTIVLNGVLFHIEEEAYNKLKEYLDSIKQYYASHNGDSEEILKDIESSIAEKFSAKLKTAKQVVSMADVEALIKVMGTVEDFAALEDDNIGETKESKKTESEGPNKLSRRLYRNPDDKIIAGVASGIASYFNIDPVIVRLLFVASVFAGGTGIIIYLVMSVIVPMAETSTQKLEMQGKPVTLKKIEQASRKLAEGGKKGIAATKKKLPAILSFFDSLFRWIGKFFRKVGPILASSLGVILVFSFALTLLSMLFAWGVLFSSIDSHQVFYGYPFKEMIGATTYYLGVSAVMVIAIIPVVFLLLASIAFMRRKNVFSSVITSILFVVWMVAVIVAGAVSVEAVPRIQNIVEDIQERIDSTRTFEAEGFTAIDAEGNYNMELVKGDNYSVEAKGFDLYLEDLTLEQNDSTIILRTKDSDRDNCYFCEEPKIDITIMLPTLEKIQGNELYRYNIVGFDNELLNVEGIDQYFDSSWKRRRFVTVTEERIVQLDDPALERSLREELNQAERAGSGEQFVNEISVIWEQFPKSD